MGLRFGRYETLEPIAAGGMAKVYRGRACADGGFERIVAIKVMHSHLACDPGFVDMFLDEARLAAKIRHPNVVATHDVLRSPVGTFLVMDYVDGVDFGLLQRALRARGVKLPLEVTLKVVIDALAGLAAAHELTDVSGARLDLVHRDVSPQNILIDRHTGTVKLTDFGVAHAAERLGTTESGALKGKLGYLSPEHARDGRVDARSDVYSAGVVLWEALTGKAMFAGRARVRVIADILQGKLEAPHAVEPTVPESISSVCMKALALAPEDRFQSVRDFSAELRRAAAGERLSLADEEAVRDFLQRSGVEAHEKKQNERLLNEEETMVEFAPDAPPSGSPAPVSRRRHLWVAAAALLLVGAGTASVPLALLAEPPAPLAAPVPTVVPPVLQMHAFEPLEDGEPSEANEGSDLPPEAGADRSAQRRRRSREKGMYHPKGL